MAEALQRRGFHGIGLNELLVQARAPKGVLYHHFPGGKTELAVAAIEATVERICSGLDQLMASHQPLQALRVWLQHAQVKLDGSQYERGCPLATVALESTAADVELRKCLANAFQVVRQRIESALVGVGHSPARAQGLAALIVSAYEGGLLQARVAGKSEPMLLATQTLLDLIEEK